MKDRTPAGSAAPAVPVDRTGRATDRTVLHRGGATVEVCYVGPDCVSVLLLAEPRRAAAHAGAGAGRPAEVSEPVGAGEPTHVNPYVRAVLEAAATSPNRLLDALGDRLGTEVAGMSLDRRDGRSLVTIDLLPTRRPASSWPRAGWSAGPRPSVPRTGAHAATA